MGWGDRRENFDDIEWNSMKLLHGELPAYLEFHEHDLGHLPQNFVDGGGASLSEEDPRFEAINRIGFYSYPVCVNLILLARTVRDLPAEFAAAIDVYDHAGRFFLRAGAATDIALRLALEVEQDFDEKNVRFCPHPLGVKGDSLAKELAESLGAVNAYNNGMKHNGLPAITLVGGNSAPSARVLVPRKFTGHQRGWLAQKPTAEMTDVLAGYQPRVFQEFNAFYGKLAADVARRFKSWGIRPAAAPSGILDVKTAGSGSVSLTDGYVAAWPSK